MSKGAGSKGPLRVENAFDHNGSGFSVGKPAISIIVPIFNVEKYLRKCLDSIVHQSLSEIEIILLNDGSTDGSLKIIEEYASGDPRIVVIDKPNEGVGKTNNVGLDRARGKYIGFVESDDWIEPDMFRILYEHGERYDVDVVKGWYSRFNEKTGKVEEASNLLRTHAHKIIFPKDTPEVFYVTPSIWSGIYRRDFLRKYDIRFLETPGASYQDTAFAFKVSALAERIYIEPKPLLYYRVGHATQSVKSKDKAFYVCDEFAEVDRYFQTYPELISGLEKTKNRVKLLRYLWNYDRLEGALKEAFRQTMESELAPLVESNRVDLSGLSTRNYCRILKILFPESRWGKARYWFFRFSGLFVRDREKNGYKQIRILFGLIRIYETPIKHKGDRP